MKRVKPYIMRLIASHIDMKILSSIYIKIRDINSVRQKYHASANIFITKQRTYNALHTKLNIDSQWTLF